MEEIYEDLDCPVPEAFRDKLGVILSITWLFFLAFVTRVMFAPLIPAIEEDLRISPAQVGSLFLMMTLGALLASFFSGFFSIRFNHRGNLVLSAWLVALVLIPFSFVDSLWAMRFLMLGVGLAGGLHTPSAIATITAQVQKKDWGKALSVHQSAPPLSFVLAPLIAALLLIWLPWRQVLLVMSGAAVCTALVYTVFGHGGRFPGRMPTWTNMKAVLKLPSFYLMILLFAMCMGGNAGIYAMLPLFLVSEKGMDLASANTLLGVSQISGFLVVFASGYISDRFGQKRTMAATLLISGITTVLLGVASGGWIALVILIQSAAVNSFFPSGFAALSRIAHPSLRSVSNAMGPPIAFVLGGGLLPSLIGFMAQTYSFAAGIMLAGVFMLVGPVLVAMLKLGAFDNAAGC